MISLLQTNPQCPTIGTQVYVLAVAHKDVACAALQLLRLVLYLEKIIAV